MPFLPLGYLNSGPRHFCVEFGAVLDSPLETSSLFQTRPVINPGPAPSRTSGSRVDAGIRTAWLVSVGRAEGLGLPPGGRHGGTWLRCRQKIQRLPSGLWAPVVTTKKSVGVRTLGGHL